MPEKKTVPTFPFIPQHDGLYDLETKASRAVVEVAEFREKEFNEDKYKCGLPETIYNVLDSFTEANVTPAVGNWLTMLALKIIRLKEQGIEKAQYEQQMIDSCKHFLKMLGEDDGTDSTDSKTKS